MLPKSVRIGWTKSSVSKEWFKYQECVYNGFHDLIVLF